MAERHGSSDGESRARGLGDGRPHGAERVRRRHGAAHGDPQGRGGERAHRPGGRVDELEHDDRDGVGHGARGGRGGGGGGGHGGGGRGERDGGGHRGAGERGVGRRGRT